MIKIKPKTKYLLVNVCVFKHYGTHYRKDGTVSYLNVEDEPQERLWIPKGYIALGRWEEIDFRDKMSFGDPMQNMINNPLVFERKPQPEQS